MEAAPKFCSTGARARAKFNSAMHADVLKGAKRSFLIAKDDRRKLPNRELDPVARITHRVDRCRHLPNTRPHTLFFERRKVRRVVPLNWHSDRSSRGWSRTCGSASQCSDVFDGNFRWFCEISHRVGPPNGVRHDPATEPSRQSQDRGHETGR